MNVNDLPENEAADMFNSSLKQDVISNIFSGDTIDSTPVEESEWSDGFSNEVGSTDSDNIFDSFDDGTNMEDSFNCFGNECNSEIGFYRQTIRDLLNKQEEHVKYYQDLINSLIEKLP